MFNHPRVATEKQRSPMNLDEFFMNRFAVRPSLSLSLNLFVNLPLEAFFRDSVCHFESGIFSRGETRVRVAEMGHADCTLVSSIM